MNTLIVSTNSPDQAPRHTGLVFFLFVILLTIQGVYAAVPPNGDFELGTTSKWSVYNPSNQPCQWNVTNSQSLVHSGNYAGALTQFGGTTNQLIIYTDYIDISAWPTGA